MPMIVTSTLASKKLSVTATNSLATHCHAQINGRLIGKLPAADAAIFTTQDHAAGIYLRNPSSWAAGVDLTCVSPWNSGEANLRAGVAVSPRHVLFAAHFPLSAGNQIRFVTADNQTITRAISAIEIHPLYSNFYPDLGVALLDSNLPSSIRFVRVLPKIWPQKIDSARPFVIPACIIDQQEKALVADFWTETSPPNYSRFRVAQNNALRASFGKNLVVGDSGSPFFLIVNNAPVLVAVATFAAGDGTSISEHIPAINLMMTSLGGGYQISTADVSKFRTI